MLVFITVRPTLSNSQSSSAIACLFRAVVKRAILLVFCRFTN